MKINLPFSNRWLCTILALGILLIIGSGVYAVAPNPGHTASEIDLSAGLPAHTVTGDLTINGAIKSPEGTLRDDGGGWIRTYGNTGWYSETWAGGWYMSDASWIRSYNSKNVYVNTLLRADGGLASGALTPGAGNIAATGSVTAASFVYSSDKSLKTNIQTLPNALDKLKQLNGVSFNWKSSGEKSIGLIAQDVEKVYPEVVITGDNGLKSVDYAKLVAVLIEAVKEQQKQIDELKAKLE